MSRWPLLGMLEPPDTHAPTPTRDPQGAYEGGVAERAVSAIRSRWDMKESCRWKMDPGDRRELGDAMLTVLSPEVGARARAWKAYQTGRRVQWNEVATALALEWRNVRLVLGSDLVEKPGGGWTAALRRSRDLSIHRGLKVPHHGSREALHRPLLSSSRRIAPPTWIVTPFAPQNLPRLDPGEGVDLLHRYHTEVHLTAAPRAYSAQGGDAGARVTRGRLHKALSAGKHIDPPRPGFPDCFVAVSFDAGGGSNVECGPCSLVVVSRRGHSRGKGGRRASQSRRPPRGV
jgi:hypothetical protein